MSKADGQDNKPKAPTAEEKQKAVKDFEAEWTRVKSGVIEGTLKPEELKSTAETLLKHRLVAGSDLDKPIDKIIDDCKKANISNKNLHEFVGAALSAELDLEKTKQGASTGIMRYSASTVANKLLQFEIQKNGVDLQVLELAKKKGNDREVVNAFIDIKIPSHIQEHYAPIIKHYEETGNKIALHETYKNVLFNTVKTPLSKAVMDEYNALKAEHGEKHPMVIEQLGEMSRVTGRISKLSAAAFPTSEIKGAAASMEDQAKALTPIIQQVNPKPNVPPLSTAEIQELKESAYKRGNVPPDAAQANSVKPQTPAKPQPQIPQKETKLDTTSKSFADRFHEVKNQTMDRLNKAETQVRTAARDVEISATALAHNVKNTVKASTVAQDIKTAGRDVFKQVETQFHNSVKDVKTSATYLTDKIVNPVTNAKDAHDIATKDNPAEKPKFSLSGKAAETAVGAIRDELVRRQREEHRAKSQQEQGARSNPSQGHSTGDKGPHGKPGPKHGSGHEGR
jgi:hypothetical protein